jgi:hypothetical protein
MYIFGRSFYLIFIESTLRIHLNFFSIWTNINKILNIKTDFCAMFKIKYGLNRMHSIISLHHGGWFDGKRVVMHP